MIGIGICVMLAAAILVLLDIAVSPAIESEKEDAARSGSEGTKESLGGSATDGILELRANWIRRLDRVDQSPEERAVSELREIEFFGGPLDGRTEPLKHDLQTTVLNIHKELGIVHRYTRTKEARNGRIVFRLERSVRCGQEAKQ